MDVFNPSYPWLPNLFMHPFIPGLVDDPADRELWSASSPVSTTVSNYPESMDNEQQLLFGCAPWRNGHGPSDWREAFERIVYTGMNLRHTPGFGFGDFHAVLNQTYVADKILCAPRDTGSAQYASHWPNCSGWPGCHVRNALLCRALILSAP